MGDFPPQFRHVRALDPGGQGLTFVVCRSDGTDATEYVLKRLINPNREDHFNNEIQAYSRLEHPHILKLIEHGRTPKGRPYVLTEYCSGGSLEKQPAFTSPAVGLRFFRKLVDAISYAHSQPDPVYHLDLKPDNVLIRSGEPVVGDFGICFIDDGQVSFTKEGQRGSRYYCPPELRNPKLTDTSRLAAADIYSLGKLLYWLYTNDVYDGHEDDYAEPERRLFHRTAKREPHFILIDELISEMVKKDPRLRMQTAAMLVTRVDDLIQRIDAQGHVLDLRVPQRCLYCAVGRYQPAHDRTPMGYMNSTAPPFPDRELRRNPPPQSTVSPKSIYGKLHVVAQAMFSTHSVFGDPAPLFLVCDYCGNVQFFRLDYTDGGKGLNWLP